MFAAGRLVKAPTANVHVERLTLLCFPGLHAQQPRAVPHSVQFLGAEQPRKQLQGIFGVLILPERACPSLLHQAAEGNCSSQAQAQWTEE